MRLKADRNDKIFVAVIMLMHVIFFLLARHYTRIYMGDSFEYIYEALNIKERGFFYSGNPALPIEIEYMTQRQPVYPFFLMFVYLFAINNWIVILLQNILSVFNIYYARSILLRLGYQKKYDWMLLLMIIAYPSQFINANTIAPDILLQTFTLLYFGNLVRYIQDKLPRYLLWSSLALAVGMLVKPVLYPFVIVHIIIVLIIALRRRSRLAGTFAVAAIPVLTMVLYSYWNYNRTGKYHFSSNQSFNAIFYYYSYFSNKEGATQAANFLDTERAKIAAIPDYKERYDYANNRGVELLSENFVPYMAFHLRNSARMFIEPGKAEMDLFTGRLTYGRLYSREQTGFFATLKSKGLAGLGEYVKHNPSMPLVLAVLLFNLIRAVGLLLFFFSSRVPKGIRLLTFVYISYFAVAAGPIANTRYFLPVSLLAIGCLVLRVYGIFSKAKTARKEIAGKFRMSALKRYTPAMIAVLLMYMILFMVFPHYQYYIDPDGTAYLTISKRYAAGDFTKAVNGYWSPWSCWLTAILIKTGIAAIPASTIVNALGATGFLSISQSFFLKFSITRNVQWLLNLTLSVFLCFAVFWQSFDDLWECFFLLCALRIMLAEPFIERPALWVATGIVGTLAYFAKAYAFPFFILNTICCTFLLAKTDKKKWLLICGTSVATMLLCSLPWIYALHSKYGFWTTGTAGSLNTSWYLVGRPFWKDVDVFIPPVFSDSPYYWEDPYVANGATPHFWSSLHLAGLQILRIGYNGLKLIISMVQLSLIFPLIALLALWILRSKQLSGLFQGNIRIIALSFVLFPLGYILVNFESRYLWYMVPLGMVIGAQAFQVPAFSFGLPPRLLTWLFPISFAVFPIAKLVEMFDNGKREYELATVLKQSGIAGTFSGNAHPRAMSKLAYFSGNPYYYVGRTDTVTSAEMLKELRHYRLKYFIDFSNEKSFSQAPFKHEPLVDENGRTFPVIPVKGAENVQILLINP